MLRIAVSLNGFEGAVTFSGEAKKILQFFCNSLFEASTLATRKYDPSLDSVNRNTSYELIKVFLESVGKDIRNCAFFVFFLNLFSCKGPIHRHIRLNQPEPQNCAVQ